MWGAAALQVTKSAQRFAVRAEAEGQNVDVEEVVKDLQEKVRAGNYWVFTFQINASKVGEQRSSPEHNLCGSFALRWANHHAF